MAFTSWNWLTPRGNLRQATQESAPSRPCLPQIEQLGDRVMLSADANIIIKGDLTAEQVLIGLLKTQLQPPGEQPSLLSSELAAIKIASLLAGDSNKLVAETVKLTHEFLRIDNVFYKFGEALIKGDLTEDVANKALSDLTDVFLKLDGIVADIGGAGENNLLLPAMQKVREAATSLLGEFSKIGPIVEIAHKDYNTYHKILLDYKLAEQALLTGFENLVFNKGGSVDSKIKFLEIKMEDVLISSYKLSEGAQKQLQVLAGNMLELANSLLQPGDGTVGLTLVDGTGDVITG